jgi:hypothetical protein
MGQPRHSGSSRSRRGVDSWHHGYAPLARVAKPPAAPTGSTRSSTTATGRSWDETARPCSFSPAAAMTGPTVIRRLRRLRPSCARSRSPSTARPSSGVDGIAVFDALHRQRRTTDAMLYRSAGAQRQGLSTVATRDRKAKLARLLGWLPPAFTIRSSRWTHAGHRSAGADGGSPRSRTRYVGLGRSWHADLRRPVVW